MCGIGGIYSATGKVKTNQVETLFKNIEDRGTDACGISYLWNNADKPIIAKAPICATNFIGRNVVKRMGTKIDWVMLHTRLTTQGSKQNNYNNHPVVRNNIILTHNGVLRNDGQVFKDLGLMRKFEVDTEAILAALHAKGLEYVAEQVRGSISIAWTSKKSNYKTMNWFTNGRNPLVIGRLKDNSIIWASLPEHFDGLDVVDYFWPHPFKHYWTNGDGMIRSEWVSEKREDPCFYQSSRELLIWNN